MRRILAIGAYERDNFGDLLFLYVLRKLIDNKAEVIASSIIAADTEPINGEFVLPYDILLKNHTFDGVYVAGGEVGAVDIVSGLTMDISSKEYQTILRNKPDLNTIVEFYTGISQNREEHAYIPDLQKYPLNKHTPLIINSVGLSNIAGLSGDFLQRTISVLRNAAVSVRENNSQKIMEKNKIASSLSPDVVHTINLFHPKHSSTKRYFTFQINTELIKTSRYSPKKIAVILQQISHALKADVRLFLAGTAAFHDDERTYKQIVQAFKLIEHKYAISITTDRNPLCLVDEISGSVLWIGTSLHGRIIAASYNVPRISLLNKKVSRYAESWDNDYPHGVAIDAVLSTVEAAVKTPADPKLANKLAKQAQRNFSQLIKPVFKKKSATTQDPLNIAKSYIKSDEKRRASFLAVIDDKNSQIARLENEAETLTNERQLLKEDLHYFKHQLKLITDSKSYRLVAFIPKLANKLRRSSK